MPHPLYDLLRTLDDLHLWYRIDRVREDTVLVLVTAAAKREHAPTMSSTDQRARAWRRWM